MLSIEHYEQPSLASLKEDSISKSASERLLFTGIPKTDKPSPSHVSMTTVLVCFAQFHGRKEWLDFVIDSTKEKEHVELAVVAKLDNEATSLNKKITKLVVYVNNSPCKDCIPHIIEFLRGPSVQESTSVVIHVAHLYGFWEKETKMKTREMLVELGVELKTFPRRDIDWLIEKCQPQSSREEKDSIRDRRNKKDVHIKSSLKEIMFESKNDIRR